MGKKPEIVNEEAAEAEADKPKTCFVMMPISDVENYPAGHFGEVYKQLIVPAVEAAGYECELATSTNSAHMIQLEVVTKVATAPLCICDLSTNNPNVLFEYGIRQAFDLPTVLIKDDKTRRLFDLSGFRDIEYDHSLRIGNTLETRSIIQKAIADTVEGSEDGKQIFSLVKLMQLTKAALPTGHVDAQDARFELLNRKLDRISRVINSQGSTPAPVNVSFNLLEALTKNPSTSVGDKYRVLFFPDSVVVADLGSNTQFSYNTLTALTASEFWKTIDSRSRTAVTSMMSQYSSDMMPY